MGFYSYVLKSDLDGRLYKGHTSRLEERIREHNSGKTSSTKGYRPWKLVYFEIFDTEKEAIEREKFFKSGIGREYLNNILRPRGATE
jgi:putative endonuclease